jgi:hypothetical protein
MSTNARKRAKRDLIRLEFEEVYWRSVELPSPEQVALKPIGTAYAFKQRLFMQPTPWCIIWVKVAPNVWLRGNEQPGPAEALADLNQKLAQKPPPEDFEWRSDDRTLAMAELPINVRADGDAPHVGLTEGTARVQGTHIPGNR